MTQTDTDWSETAISLLKMLVEIPSPSGAEDAASSALAEWMTGQRFDAHLDQAGNCIGYRGDGPNEIVLLGHIDTVPSQLPVIIKDGWLCGRGAVDAKGPLAAFAMAAALVSIPNDWRVRVIGAVEEEAPTSKGARQILKSHHVPHYCIIGEPSRWDRITLGYKGIFQVKIHMEIPQSHASGQYLQPAECAIEFWNAIKDYCDDFNSSRAKLFDQLIPSLRTINSEMDGPLGVVELELSFRLPIDSDPGQLEEMLKDIAAGLRIEQLRIELLGEEKAVRTSKNTPLVRAFLSAIRQSGGKPKFVYKTGTSDMNVIAPHWNCPIVAYGPGDSSLDHTPGERIDIAEFLKSIKILRDCLALSMTARLSAETQA